MKGIGLGLLLVALAVSSSLVLNVAGVVVGAGLIVKPFVSRRKELTR